MTVEVFMRTERDLYLKTHMNKRQVPIPPLGIAPAFPTSERPQTYAATGICRENLNAYRSTDKSLARPGRKQATATKLSRLQATQKKIRTFSVQPGLRGSNDLDVGRKMATFQLFFQSGRAKDFSAPLYKAFNNYAPFFQVWVYNTCRAKL